MQHVVGKGKAHGFQHHRRGAGCKEAQSLAAELGDVFAVRTENNELVGGIGKEHGADDAENIGNIRMDGEGITEDPERSPTDEGRGDADDDVADGQRLNRRREYMISRGSMPMWTE